MAAPSTGRPVTLTVGTVCKFHLEPPPPEPPRLSVKVLIICTVLTAARIIFGVVYFKECPQQPNIPNYLLGFALCTLLMTSFVTFPCESQTQPRGPPGGFKACAQFLLSLFFITWIVLGNVWVFSIYQPNYDPTTSDGLYCNKTLYTFAFWNCVYETVGIGVELARFCKGLLCFLNMHPAPGDAHVYSYV